MNNHFYLAKAGYGGWVSFTVHLLLVKKHLRLYKLANKLEANTRPFGYGVRYQNVSPEALNVGKVFIVALDKNYYGHVKY